MKQSCEEMSVCSCGHLAGHHQGDGGCFWPDCHCELSWGDVWVDKPRSVQVGTGVLRDANGAYWVSPARVLRVILSLGATPDQADRLVAEIVQDAMDAEGVPSLPQLLTEVVR